MRYRNLGNTGFQVSEVGLGCEYLESKERKTVEDVIHASMDNGINILDCFMSEPNVRSDIGHALKGRRDRMYVQGHFRSVWENGQYGRTMEIEKVKFFFEDLLHRLDTDYIDLGMIHIVDNPADYEKLFHGEIFAYASELKKAGIVRKIGISTHNPATALLAAKSGNIDMMLLSINPAYDVLHETAARPKKLGNDFFDTISMQGINHIRQELYNYCASNGVGITAMKTLAAGALLNEKTTPFARAMTVQQCMHYALTRPAVASVLVGMQSVEQVQDCLRYEEMSEEELDYSGIFAQEPRFNMEGRCMYCNHCLPCAAKINIAEVNKYLDMATLEGVPIASVRAHYESLDHKADECLECGQCEKRCPFHVNIRERMRKASEIFSKE